LLWDRSLAAHNGHSLGRRIGACISQSIYCIASERIRVIDGSLVEHASGEVFQGCSILKTPDPTAFDVADDHVHAQTRFLSLLQHVLPTMRLEAVSDTQDRRTCCGYFDDRQGGRCGQSGFGEKRPEATPRHRGFRDERTLVDSPLEILRQACGQGRRVPRQRHDHCPQLRIAFHSHQPEERLHGTEVHPPAFPIHSPPREGCFAISIDTLLLRRVSTQALGKSHAGTRPHWLPVQDRAPCSSANHPRQP
jgi:hypothetical protein